MKIEKKIKGLIIILMLGIALTGCDTNENNVEVINQKNNKEESSKEESSKEESSKEEISKESSKENEGKIVEYQINKQDFLYFNKSNNSMDNISGYKYITTEWIPVRDAQGFMNIANLAYYVDSSTGIVWQLTTLEAESISFSPYVKDSNSYWTFNSFLRDRGMTVDDVPKVIYKKVTTKEDNSNEENDKGLKVEDSEDSKEENEDSKEENKSENTNEEMTMVDKLEMIHKINDEVDNLTKENIQEENIQEENIQEENIQNYKEEIKRLEKEITNLKEEKKSLLVEKEKLEIEKKSLDDAVKKSSKEDEVYVNLK